MAKATKNSYKPAKRIGNYKPIKMAEGGNVSELGYSERREYIEENYAPFITDAQMIFSIWDSGIQYDYKADRKEVVNTIIEEYKNLGDYTEATLPQETIYEIQDWDLVRREIDPETDEVIGETPLKEISSDNTYNFSYNGLVNLNWKVYHDEDYDRFFYVITPHLGGDIRGNYGDAIILEGNDRDDLFYRFYEGFVNGGASVYFKFKDGSEIGFDSEQDSDVFYFRVNEGFDITGMAQKYLNDFEKFESWQGDEFLEETIDIYLARKGVAPKMMAGGSLNDETPKAYIQILGYDEGKWITITDYSDGQDVIDGIYDWMVSLNEQFGGNREEYEVADYEGFGEDLYDQYMSSNEFDEIIEAYEKYESSDFPADVISAYKKDSGSGNDSLSDVIDEMDNNYFGKYDNLTDFGYEMVSQGVYTPSESDVYITDTDKRIIAGEEADALVDDMSFNDLLNVAVEVKSEYEDEKSELEDKITEIEQEIEDLTELQNSSDDDDDEYETISESIEEKEIELEEIQNELDEIDSRFEDKAREEARELFYDEIHDKLENDLEGWLSDYGYDTDNLADVSFISVDYEKIGDELSSDYLVIEFEGEMYFFNNYAKGGRITASKRKPKYAYYIVENSTKKLVSGYSSKAEAIEQRKLLIQQYPSLRFEIYPLANLEAKTDLDVYAKKDYVELSTLDKIKKVSIDAYRYGQEKVGQAQVFLEKNDVKGKIKRGARNVANRTKQGANWLRNKWLEADFGDGKGRAKFFADGGGVDDVKSDLNKYKNVDIRFKLIPNDGSEEDGDDNDLSLNYVGEIYGGGLDLDEPFVELGFQVNDEADDSINLKSDLNKYKNVDIRFKLIPNDGSEEDGDENDLSLNYIGEIYGGELDSDEPYVELGFQVTNKYADGGISGSVEGGVIDLSNKEKFEMYNWLDNINWSNYDEDIYQLFGEKFGKNSQQTEDIIDRGWAVSRGLNKGKFADGGEVTFFDRHASMDSETRDELQKMTSYPFLKEYFEGEDGEKKYDSIESALEREDVSVSAIKNYLSGLYDGYNYSNTEGFKKEMAKLKIADKEFYDRIIKVYEKISKYPKIEREYADGGGVESQYKKGVVLVKSAKASNDNDVWNILNEKWKKYNIVNSRAFDLETPYNRGWIDEGISINVYLLKDTETNKYYWDSDYIEAIKNKMANGGLVENQINELYNKSNFIGNHQNWKLKLLEMLQDESNEAYNIYQSLTQEQKEQLLQELFEMDNDMGSDGDGEMETSKENLNILLDGAKNGKKYRSGGVTDEVAYLEGRIYNLEELVVNMNEEDKPEIYATINKLKKEKENLIKKRNNPEIEEVKPKKSFFGLFEKGGKIALPKDNSKVHFTDDQNREYYGRFIEDENMFFIGFEDRGDFRYSFEIIDWKYINDVDDDAHAKHEASETAEEEKAEHKYDVYDNKRMLKNQAKEVEHHSEELNNQVEITKRVPAWVVAKMERATTDLSDITHYLDGENKMAYGGSVGGERYDVVPFGNKFVVVRLSKQTGSKKGVIIREFNGDVMKFDDINSAKNFIKNIEPKYPYGIPKANAGMIILASQLLQQKQQQQQQQQQPQPQPQVVYYVPQTQPQPQEPQNTGIIQNIPEMESGGELDYDNDLVNDFCMTNLIELANEIQAVKYVVTDRFKQTDFESKKYKGRLIIVFKEPASINVVNSITKFIARAEDCHHIFEQSVNASGTETNGISINLLSDKFTDREFNKGGKVYENTPQKINLSKTKKITTNLGDYNLGLITNDFVYFVNATEEDENAQTIMYNKKGELLSDNIHATNDFFQVLETQDTFEFIHPDIEAYRQTILKEN